jgi:hypothetical protein
MNEISEKNRLQSSQNVKSSSSSSKNTKEPVPNSKYNYLLKGVFSFF